MNNRQGFRMGLRAYGRATSFMFRNGLVGYFIFPVLFNVLLFVLGLWSVSALSDDLVTALTSSMDSEAWDFWGSSWLLAIIKGFVWLVLRLMFFILYAYVGGYLIIILLSPVFALLSEKTEEIITGRKLPFDFRQFISDIIRGVLLALRNLVVEIGITLMLFILSFVPLIGYFTPVALFLVSAYFYGFSFMDYTFERKRFKLNYSVRFMRQNRGLAVGSGFVFSLVLLIPYVGVMLAGFVSLVSVVAATLAATEALENEQGLWV